MKRLVAVLLALVMVLSLVACGTKEEPAAEEKEETSAPAVQEETKEEAAPAEKTEMSLWLAPQAGGTDQEFWEATLAGWAEENNVELSISIIPWSDYEERYMTAFASGEGPDVGYMYKEMMYEYLSNGQLEILDDYLTDADKENYTLLNLGEINGHQYTIPFAPGGIRTMYCNMDILAAAGVEEAPGTWEEFVDTCIAVKDANLEGVIPYIGEWGSNSIGVLNACYYPFLWQAGGELFNGNEIALMDNDAAVEAAQFVYDLMHTHEVMPEEALSCSDSDTQTMFTEGRLAFYCASVNKIAAIEEAGINWSLCGEDYAAHLEKEEGSGWTTFVAADALIMNAASEHKDLSWDLIHHITSAEIMNQVREGLFNGPKLTKDATNSLNETAAALFSQRDQLKSLPVAANSAAVMNQLKNNLQLMLMDELTPEEAISNTVDYANSLN